MISVAEAISIVTSSLNPVSTQWVEASSALGRVPAEDVAARLDQPPADVSAMDGYAVRVDDVDGVPTNLNIVGESAAGAAFGGTVASLQAVRISTGAAVPQGANSVVIQEDTRRRGDVLTILKMPTPNRWIRPAGLDFHIGQILLRAGRFLTARDVGLLAAMNVPWISVYRKPRVAFLATGNEVVFPGTPVGQNQIVSSNSAALAAAILALGGEPLNLGIAGDSETSLETKLRNLGSIDLLITVGGASVGDHDLVLSVLKKIGFQLHFHKIAMRPGKPILFGQLGNVPVLGLPGNPVSVGVATSVMLGPAIEAMSGIGRQVSECPAASLNGSLAANDERQDYLRARLSLNDDGILTATPLEKQDSSMLAAFAAADCLIVRPPHAPPAVTGERIEYISLKHSHISL